MSNIELLDNVTHKDLKVITQNSAKLGDNNNDAMIFANEFVEIQREYPIFLRKDPETGQFYASAMLGLEQNENLFLHNDRWMARYIPAVVARGPFLIGFQQKEVNGQVVKDTYT